MPKKKLTLRIEEHLIDRTKRKARERGTSVSQMVSDYFTVLEEGEISDDESLPPLTRSLARALKDSDVDESDYYRYLTEKHQ